MYLWPIFDTAGVSYGSSENIGTVAPLLSHVSTKMKKTYYNAVKDSILKAVLKWRRQGRREKDGQYARAISITEIMDALEDLQFKYYPNR